KKILGQCPGRGGGSSGSFCENGYPGLRYRRTGSKSRQGECQACGSVPSDPFSEKTGVRAFPSEKIRVCVHQSALWGKTSGKRTAAGALPGNRTGIFKAGFLVGVSDHRLSGCRNI